VVHWQTAPSPQNPVFVGLQEIVQKYEYVFVSSVPLAMELHKVATLLLVQSSPVWQYFPTPTELPTSPGEPQLLT
jgi:hypothetical protein